MIAAEQSTIAAAGPTAATAAAQLAKARADLAKATTAVKLAATKRARLAAEVRALEAEAELEILRPQARADRERAEAAEARAQAAEAALAKERAAHLAEGRAHADEIASIERPVSQNPTTGGTGANFAAVLMARERAFPGSRADGLPSGARPVIVLPDGIGHYTIAAAAAWAGLGNTAAAHHPMRDFRYDLTELDRSLNAARAGGEQVIMAVCYAGDSRTMTIEKLAEFAEVVRRHYPHAWLHCDGCHGTSLLFSPFVERTLRTHLLASTPGADADE